MKSFFYLLLCLTGGTLQAQSITAQPLTKEQIQQGLGDQLANGYQTSIDGWVMHKGDTLQLGKSTPTNNPFVYLYQTITDPKTNH